MSTANIYLNFERNSRAIIISRVFFMGRAGEQVHVEVNSTNGSPMLGINDLVLAIYFC